MFKILSPYISVFFSIIYSGAVYSQHNGLLIEQSLDIKIPFTITQYSTKNGLPQSRVIDIVSRDNGNLIILTANGIVEYNGSEFISFINGDFYKSFYYSKLIWHEKTGKLFGISDGGSIKLIYPIFKAIDGFRASCLFRDTLFSITSEGEIYSANIDKLTFKKRCSSKVINAQCLLFDSTSFLIGSINGLYRYSLDSKKTTQLQAGNFSELKENSFNGSIYAIANNKVLQVAGQQISNVLDLSKSKNSILIQNIAFRSEDDYYISTTLGLYEVTKEYTDHYTIESALPSNFLQALHYDLKENCLFVGTGVKGLLKLQFKNCYTFTTKQGFAESASVSSIIRTKTGKTLVVNYQGTIYQLKIDTVLKLIDLKTACASLAEVEDLIYVGTWHHGILLVQGNKLIDSIQFPNQLPDKSVHAIFKDSKGTIWVGTDKGIAKGENYKGIQPFLSKEISKGVICFYELRNKSICIGGKDGAYIINKNNSLETHLGEKEGLVSKEVRSFYEDAEGKLWIGTYDGGLYCYYKNRLTSINLMKNSKLDRDVFCLAKDQFGYLYMTSNHGLWRIEEKKLSDFYSGKINYLIPFYYGEENGIVNTEFDGGFQNNYLRTTMNHFYFPSIEGIVIVDPEETNFRKLVPQLNQVFVNDTLHDFKNRKLNDKTFSIAFNFSCLSYMNKYNLYYQYKLQKGSKEEWSSLQKNTSVTFKMLPAGHYTFSVRALDAFNDEKPQEVSYPFEIQPVFYDTFWFKLIAFSIFLSLVILVVRLRMIHFRKKGRARERVRRQLAEFELRATHAQMNPHFIFNSLNSIKYYLSINDQKNADNYIDHFSSLLRSFLENGSKDFIEIKEEIHILTSYLELEKQRMNPSFSYSLIANQELYPVLIPTHIVQPFVENAIKHGINHSEKKCHLSIRFYRHDQSIMCEIDDDGIGRDKSRMINKGGAYHKSKGLDMVMEKIRIVNEIYKFEIILNIEDKFDGMNNSIGTIVKIKIPLPSHENSNS